MRSILLFLIVPIFMIACGDDTVSYSLLPEEEIFEQKGVTVNEKMDILWVVDNSGSMRSSQESVANSFNAFINRFATKGYDYKIAVTTTSAFLDQYGSKDPLKSKFRDGTDQTSHSGVFVITPQTPNLVDVFLINIIQGILGTGDERGLQSMRNTLNNPLNAGFLREDSFLSVIFITDEEDYSHDSSGYSEDLNIMHPVQDYVDFLDEFTNTSGATRRHSASTIGIFDEDCRQALNDADPAGWNGRKIANRYGALADATEGVKGSLCENFDLTLDQIAEQIVRLSTQFYLSREPIVETLRIFVDEVQIPNSIENGWQYNEERNSIVFYGNSIPAQGQKVRIDYDPSKVVL
jgi:hypothetical protein